MEHAHLIREQVAHLSLVFPVDFPIALVLHTGDLRREVSHE